MDARIQQNWWFLFVESLLPFWFMSLCHCTPPLLGKTSSTPRFSGWSNTPSTSPVLSAWRPTVRQQWRWKKEECRLTVSVSLRGPRTHPAYPWGALHHPWAPVLHVCQPYRYHVSSREGCQLHPLQQPKMVILHSYWANFPWIFCQITISAGVVLISVTFRRVHCLL